jgi:hypothetical protein
MKRYSLFIGVLIALIFNTGLNAQTYCTNSTTYPMYMGITGVQLNTISYFNSSNSGYLNNTALSTTLIPGNSYTINVYNSGIYGVTYNQWFSVWIDFNKDGVFNNTNERLVSSASMVSSGSASFTIPTTGFTGGNTRMRVKSEYYGYTLTDACQAQTYGETEDYTVVLPSAGALHFDGVNDQVNCGNGSSVSNLATGGLTLEARISVTNAAIINSIIRKTGDYNLYVYGNKLYAEIWDIGGGNPSWKRFSGTTTLASNTSTHVAAVWKGNSFTFYVNGVVDPSDPSTMSSASIGGSENLYLGESSIYYNQPFGGTMDEVRIWGRALCQGEIQNNMSCELSGTQTALKAYYKFNQGIINQNNSTVTSLTDASGNGNNGTFISFGMTGASSNFVAGLVTGTCSIVAPEINLKGNNVSIVDGDNTPSTTDNTNMGTTLPGVSINKTFTIENTGNSPLSLSSITGSGSSSFAISGTPSFPATVAAGGSIAFTVTYSSTTVGGSSFTVNIASNDCDEANYDFAVSGEVNCSMPAFTSCPSNITANTVTGTCSAQAIYATAVSGVPQPSLTYTLTGATTASGNGNGSGSSFNKGVTNVTITASNACGTVNCIFTVTVSDNQAPSIACPANITTNVSGPVLLANYPLATNLTDATGNFGAVILSGNPTAPAAPTAGNPLCENGIYRQNVNGQDVQTPNIGTLNTSAFEIEVDFRLSGYASTTSGAPVLMGGNGFRWIGIYTSNTGMAGITWNNSSFAYSTTQLNLNQWYSARLSFSAGTAKLYIDGNLVQTTSTGALITGGNLNFTTNNFSNGTALNGCIRNLSISNGTTTCSAPITIASPVTSDNCTAPNNSLMFDGADDRVIGTNSVLPLGASARTIEAWVFPKSNTIQTIYNYGNFAFNQRSGLLLLGGHLYYVGQNNDFNATAAIVPVNQWSHVAVTLSGTSVSFYVNGTLVQFGNLGATPATAGNSWTIGTASGTLYEPMNGAVDEVRVWNTVRTQSEIFANMNTSFSGTLPANLVANYNFNQGVANGNNISVTTLNDQTGNGTGTLTSFNGLNNGTTSNWSAGAPALGNGIMLTNNITNTANASGIFPVGATTVVWTATDPAGNTSTCSQTVTVIDNILPIVRTQNVTVQLSAAGSASITAAHINSGSGDNCGIASISVSPSSFSCATIGNNTVTLTVTDIHGNVATGTAIVTIEDHVAPVVATQNITVQLNTNGTASIIADDVNNGSTDACGIQSTTVSPNTFNCSNVGTNTVTLTVTDNNGNVSTATAVVTIEDHVAPVVLTKNITVQLNASGAASIVADDVNDGSTDACGIASMTVSSNTFSCSNVGANTVILTVTDHNGNESTATAIVIVEDHVAPVVLTKNITVQLNASGTASIVADDVNDGSTDACGIAGMTVSSNTFSCSNVGANTVTLTVTDNNGNVSTATAIVIVEDHVAPVVLTKNITVQLNASGTASIVADDVNDGSNDACGIQSMIVSPSTFNCSNVGANTVTLTVTDNNGNELTATAIVTVEDLVAPVALAKNITVQLNANGAASIVADDVNDGSTDACGIQNMTVSPNTFSCSNVGVNIVTLTVTDNNGNVSTATAIVTVEDHIAPVALAKNITIQLNANGAASILADDVNNGSTDACGIQSMTVSPNTFSCSNVGANTVTLTVTDNNGNVSTVTAVVTVEDHVAPVVLTKNITIQLNASGAASIVAGDVNNGSTDACGIQSVTVSPNMFSCSNVGANTVTLTVTDNHGNTSTGTATVTVEDKIAPIAICKNLTVTISGGSVSITAAQVNNGSNDACGIKSLSLSKTSFSCSEIGNNTVTLTVTDNNNNVSTCQATVTVNGVVPSCSITATASNNTYTGAAANQMFIGYGPQSMNLQVTATGAGPFTYSWSGPYLSSTTVANPVFTPAVGGSYTLTCSVTNSYGCVSTCSIVICVLDVRAPGGSTSNPKVYLCHVPNGNPSNAQTLQISVSAVPAHLSHTGDKLGTCSQTCGLAKTGNESSGEIFSEVTGSGEVDLIVYPNPSSSVFSFKLETESEAPVNIRLYDMSGRVVYELTGASAKEAITIGEQIGVGMFMAEVKQGEFYKVVKITKVN